MYNIFGRCYPILHLLSIGYLINDDRFTVLTKSFQVRTGRASPEGRIFKNKMKILSKSNETGHSLVVRRNLGFSVIELLVVLSILTILSAFSIPYILNYKKAYKSEDQSLKIMDLMQETAQLALTKRRTMRLEIDLTANAILVIDERFPDPVTGLNEPDRLIKSIPMERPLDVRVDVAPTGVARPIPPDYANAVYAADARGHLVGAATVINNNVWMARFLRDGSVVNTAGNPLNATLFVWPPLTFGNAAAKTANEVRAITIFGGSGAVRYWKYNGATFVAN